jgi:hypothetical protein
MSQLPDLLHIKSINWLSKVNLAPHQTFWDFLEAQEHQSDVWIKYTLDKQCPTEKGVKEAMCSAHSKNCCIRSKPRWMNPSWFCREAATKGRKYCLPHI